MHRRPMWAFECLDREEALALLAKAPLDSHVEVLVKEAGELVILWVPVPDEVLKAELGDDVLWAA